MESWNQLLEFTPLEFETAKGGFYDPAGSIRIYSVGVWNTAKIAAKTTMTAPLEFTPLEFETIAFVKDKYYPGN